MNHSIFAEAIASVAASRLDDLFRDVTSANLRARITDDEAESLYAAIYARRSGGAAGKAAPRRQVGRNGTIFTPRSYQRSPDKEASVQRRRATSSSGAMPPPIAARFSEAERAVLAVVVLEISKNGVCDRSIAEIAARAGVCASTAKNALRVAEREALVLITRRPRPGRKNLTNLVVVISEDWLTWIAKGSGKRSTSSIGVKPLSPTNSSISRREKKPRKTFSPFAGRQGSKELRGKAERSAGTSDGIAWGPNTAMFRE